MIIIDGIIRPLINPMGINKRTKLTDSTKNIDEKIDSIIRDWQLNLIKIFKGLVLKPDERIKLEKSEEMIKKGERVDTSEMLPENIWVDWVAENPALREAIDQKEEQVAKQLLVELAASTKNKQIRWRRYVSRNYSMQKDIFHVRIHKEDSSEGTVGLDVSLAAFPYPSLFRIYCDKSRYPYDEISTLYKEIAFRVGEKEWHEENRLSGEHIFKQLGVAPCPSEIIEYINIAGKIEWRPKQNPNEIHKEYLALYDGMEISVKKVDGFYFLTISMIEKKKSFILISASKDAEEEREKEDYLAMKKLYKKIQQGLGIVDKRREI